MISRSAFILPAAFAGLAAPLSGCGNESDASMAANTEIVTKETAATFPASLAAFGDGYPEAGDVCRRLGESDATREWLDDSSDLVGCRTAAAAAALNGRVLATVEGVTVISVPRAAAAGGEGQGSEDALVGGTAFNATGQIRCSMNGSAPTEMCIAGARRRAGPDGTTIVEIKRPNGMPRVIFFQGTKAQSADSAQTDGSAAYAFSATRSGDETTISFGPERYIIPDAFVEGS